MKFSVTTLLASSLAVLSANALELQPTFRQGNLKNIAFSVAGGGSSHHNWVLSIVDLLGQRGHNISYLAPASDHRFGKPYQNVNIIDLGPRAPFDMVGLMKQIVPGGDRLNVMSKGFKKMTQDYEQDYFTQLSYFENGKIDIALCDHFMRSCVDAATTAKIPYIITAAAEFTKESRAPYINNRMLTTKDFSTEFQSFSERFKSEFITPWIAFYKFYSFSKEMNARKRAVGVDATFGPPEETWKNSLKLINNQFGFTPARPIGPMAEFVGPIIPKVYSPLTAEIEAFLNHHKRVAYVSFGQNAVPSEKNIALILTSLLESLENNFLDGFLWATVNSADLFPDVITTSSGTKYNVDAMFSHVNPHARMIKWVPQTAVLLHPSTNLFVSHGGLGSWYESMYSGTPMIMFPFFGDQPGNSLMVERGGLGGILKFDATIEEVVELFKKITEDKDKKIEESIKRMQALTQIHSEHGVIRGADLVEEVVYTHQNGKLPYRQSADKRMSYIKSHNIDLYAALFLVVATGLATMITLVLKACTLFTVATIKEEETKNYDKKAQ